MAYSHHHINLGSILISTYKLPKYMSMRFTEYLVEATVEPQQPQQAGMKPRGRMAGNTGTFVPNQAKPNPAPAKPDRWDAIKKAATDPTAGREFITLLGAMYQAKRSNPTVQMKMPSMVTALPQNTPEEQNLKKLMAQLFQLAANDDEAHLAQRTQELQQARMNAASKPGTTVKPGQQPAGQVKTAPGPQQGQNRGELLKTLMKSIQDAAPNLTTRQIKSASAALNAPLRAKRVQNRRTKTPSAPVPGPSQNPGIVGTG